MRYAEILINHRFSQIQGTLTYGVPKNLQKSLKKGQLVKIPFRNKTINGIILYPHNKKPSYATKNILEILSNDPVLLPEQLTLIHWIQTRYFSDLYRTCKLFLPQNIFSGKFPKIAEKIEQSTLKFPIKTSETFTKEVKKCRKNIIIYHHDLTNKRFEHYRNLAIEQYLKGKQTLILTAETNLTPTLIRYFQDAFHNEMAGFGSQLTEKEKAEAWMKVWKNQISLVIGSRSALFLPFHKPGLIIMDQEHDSLSYKQEQTPRYCTKNVALEMISFSNAKLILASHAPSIESYYLSTGKAKILREKTAFNRKVTIVDLRDELRKGNYSPISDTLEEKMRETLEAKLQVLLFFNKKGSATALSCRECGEKVTCTACGSIPMLYRIKNMLKCQRCTHEKTIPVRCPKCHSTYLKELGSGTEKLEQEVRKRFPHARILRLDMDTVKTRKNFAELYKKTEDVDIIIGTQMLLKAEKYDNVGLIGIILADLNFSHSDFRSEEQGFQTLTNVLRLKTAGDECVIQTYQPRNFTLKRAIHNDYIGLYKEEINNRRDFIYPPFAKIIKLTYQDKNELRAKCEAESMMKKLQNTVKRSQISDNTAEGTKRDNIESITTISLFPAIPFMLRGMYRYNILIRGKNLHKIIEKALCHFDQNREPETTSLCHFDQMEKSSTKKSIPVIKIPSNWRIDVDPIDLS